MKRTGRGASNLTLSMSESPPAVVMVNTTWGHHIPSGTSHRVQHISLLNRDGFWWLMGTTIFLVAGMVFGVEVQDQMQGEKSGEEGQIAQQENVEERKKTASSQPQCNLGSASKQELGVRVDQDDAGATIPQADPVVKVDRTLQAQSDSTAPYRPHLPTSDRGPTAQEADHGKTWQQATRLAVCFFGLNISMLFWGIAQEYVLTNEYQRPNGELERFPSSLFLVLCNRLCSMCVSGLLLWILGLPFVFRGYLLAGAPAISNLIASWSQYASLAYVSFPLQTAAKSSKLLPVLVIGSLRGKRYGVQEYLEALVITSGVVVFGLELEASRIGGLADITAEAVGAVLLLCLIFADAVTPHLQDVLFQQHPEVKVVQATFGLAVVASIISAVGLMFSGTLGVCLAFLWTNPEALLHVAVLSLCSAATQLLIAHTIKHFGPIAFTIIVTTRQVISVCVSASLFSHTVSRLAWVAAVLVFGTVVCRALRKLWPEATPPPQPSQQSQRPFRDEEDHGSCTSLDSRPYMMSHDAAGPLQTRATTLTASPAAVHSSHRDGRSGRFFLTGGALDRGSRHWKMVVCAVAIHVPLLCWAVAQEFLTTHSYGGKLFPSPLFLIACNKVCSVLFAICALTARGLPLYQPGIHLAVLPAATNFVATWCQYKALYFVHFPTQTLLKTMKLIPVMLCGTLLRNRTYGLLDALEAVVITICASFFVWYFEGSQPLLQDSGALPGLALMVGYLFFDSMTSNTEDLVYQQNRRLDPAQMLLGAELAAALVSVGALMVSGDLFLSIVFLIDNPQAVAHVAFLAVAASAGAYACVVTVRFFGPAVFTLLMMSRQTLSMMVSVYIFRHNADVVSSMCLVVVAMLMFTSSLRRINTDVQNRTALKQ